MNSRILHLSCHAPSFPAELELVEDPPAEIWLRGHEEILAHSPRIAIVGTRSPTPYGEAQAQRFASVLAESGVVIVSGMARGIDQCAHRGALDVGGETVAVLGGGLDRPWPAHPIAGEIAERGLLLSEYAPGQAPRRHHFPLRNRLIAGLSQAVLVIEAAWASGSLITARWALDQGRDVLAIPGRIDHPMARGAHRLIREGATLIESPEQLLADVFPELSGDGGERGEGQNGGGSGAHKRQGKGESGGQPVKLRDSPLLSALVGETLTANELARTLQTAIPHVLEELAQLELIGRVVRCPGALYRLP